jgi:hypothetical protein
MLRTADATLLFSKCTNSLNRAFPSATGWLGTEPGAGHSLFPPSRMRYAGVRGDRSRMSDVSQAEICA